MDILIYFSIPVFILLILLEFKVGKKQGQSLYTLPDTLACLSMGTGNLLVNMATAGAVYGLYLLCYEARVFDFPATSWVSWAILLVAEDFCYYWFHRTHHESRIGWAGHVNHHSSQEYNLAVALRQSWTTRFTGVFFWLPLAFMGFHPLMIITQQSISLIYQFWIHTKLIDRLGPLEYLFNTPSHHRVHHGSNPQYIDRNYGGIFIIWDRLFGSFEPEGEAVDYGLTKNIRTYNPFKIAFHEWRDMLRDVWFADSFKQRMGYLFKHPGWSPPSPESRHHSAQ